MDPVVTMDSEGPGRSRVPAAILAAVVGAALVPAAGWLVDAASLGTPEPVDVSIAGRLEEGDSTLPQDGSFFDDHVVRAGEGWRIEARLESDDFDAWLQLFGPDGRPLAQNDDEGAGTTHAALQHTAQRAGRYTLRANTREPGMAGGYTLRVRAAPPTDDASTPGSPRVTPRPGGSPRARGSAEPRPAAGASP